MVNSSLSVSLCEWMSDDVVMSRRNFEFEFPGSGILKIKLLVELIAVQYVVSTTLATVSHTVREPDLV
jgi:hypothetical protein